MSDGKYRIDIGHAQNIQIGDHNTQHNTFTPAKFEAPGAGRELGGSDRPWRVFISHTTELSRFPADRSFIAAARDAVTRAGHVPVEMQTFTAASMPTRQACEERLRACDVYVGVLGFVWGTAVRDDPARSYTELEYDTATSARMPRLIMVVDEEADLAVPRSFWVDAENGAKQKAFRTKVENDVTRAGVVGPAQLETKLYQALVELAQRAAGPAR